jgi:DNA-directed RNA polymerase subunit N (RpoN/RPB10)
VQIWAHARTGTAACPHCGRASARVHSRYQRRFADAAIGGRRVVIRLGVRRFFCDETACQARTFTEQIAGLTTRYARRTPLLKRMLQAIGLALAGRAGARLTSGLGLPASRDSLLRLLRGLPDLEVDQVAVLGVDLSRRGDYPDPLGAGRGSRCAGRVLCASGLTGVGIITGSRGRRAGCRWAGNGRA